MSQKSFRCKLVTPMAALVDDQVKYASIPAWDGLLGVLPGRAAMLARLGMGELRLDFASGSKGEGGSRSYLVEGGFVKMAGDQLTILAERATPTETLTLAEAEAELKTAQSATATGTGAAKLAQAEKISADVHRARLKVRLAKTRGGI